MKFGWLQTTKDIFITYKGTRQGHKFNIDGTGQCNLLKLKEREITESWTFHPLTFCPRTFHSLSLNKKFDPFIGRPEAKNLEQLQGPPD